MFQMFLMNVLTAWLKTAHPIALRVREEETQPCQLPERVKVSKTSRRVYMNVFSSEKKCHFIEIELLFITII